MSKLVVRSGPQSGIEFPVDKPVVRIGRGSGNDIVLQTTQASRQHAEISRQGDQFFIRDLGSTNGTFVNDQAVTAPQPLRRGDRVRIGDVQLAFDVGPLAAPGPATDWEADLWNDRQSAAGAPPAKSKTMIWVLAGLAAVLLIGVGVAAALLLKGDGETTPVAGVETAIPTQVIVVAASATPEAAQQGQPTVTPLVEVPTVAVQVPTVAVQVTAPAVNLPKVPTNIPTSPGDLEKLPAMVQQYLGDVPPDQLPQAIAQQMQTLSPEELQAMIASLFPGVDVAQLPAVVAASFPGLPQAQVQALLGQVFPGQTFQIPQVGGAVSGRIAVGIWDGQSEWRDLYLVNVATGASEKFLSLASEPAVSPDRQWMVYYSRDPSKLGLRLIKLDGTGDMALTSGKEHAYPSFSPDGQRIVFHQYDQDQLYVMNRDGTNQRGLTKGQYPAWSPTGEQIAYRGCVGGGRCGLVVANSDGANPRLITTHANDAAPRWSPNGGQIAFHSDRDGNWEIYVINLDGTWLRRITTNPTTDIMPEWSPDGLRIAFGSDRGGKWAVWVTTGVGGPATKLVDAGNVFSDWSTMDWFK
jgi:hypothetical protein